MENKINIADLVQRQRQFFQSNETKNIQFRKEQLKILKNLIISNETEIYKVLDSDFRKPPFETYLSENGYMIMEISLILEKLKKWIRRRRLPSNLLNFPSSSFLIYEPYGVSFIISPWNYPFQLAISPLVGAMAAGNCAILKPSELTPSTSEFIRKLINENFRDDYIHVIEGDATVTQSLLKEKFDYIFFTGSTRVGQIIAEAAAKNLTPVTLELGGKSPCFVDGSIDMKLTARRIIWGKFLNNGQTCLAPDYIYVDQQYKDELLGHLKNEIIRRFGNDPEKSRDLARVINKDHFNRLKGLISKEKVFYGGIFNEKYFYISPTILQDISWKDKVMNEEIFGPILPILSYDDIDKVIQSLKIKEKPLSLYVFSRRKAFIKKVLHNLSFGDGTINDTVIHFGNPSIPFGGVGQSGYGTYHGKYSFETFSHKKGILKKATWLDIPIRYAPYDNKMRWLKKLFMANFEW